MTDQNILFSLFELSSFFCCCRRRKKKSHIFIIIIIITASECNWFFFLISFFRRPILVVVIEFDRQLLLLSMYIECDDIYQMNCCISSFTIYQFTLDSILFNSIHFIQESFFDSFRLNGMTRLHDQQFFFLFFLLFFAQNWI